MFSSFHSGAGAHLVCNCATNSDRMISAALMGCPHLPSHYTLWQTQKSWLWGATMSLWTEEMSLERDRKTSVFFSLPHHNSHNMNFPLLPPILHGWLNFLQPIVSFYFPGNLYLWWHHSRDVKLATSITHNGQKNQWELLHLVLKLEAAQSGQTKILLGQFRFCCCSYRWMSDSTQYYW